MRKPVFVFATALSAFLLVCVFFVTKESAYSGNLSPTNSTKIHGKAVEGNKDHVHHNKWQGGGGVENNVKNGDATDGDDIDDEDDEENGYSMEEDLDHGDSDLTYGVEDWERYEFPLESPVEDKTHRLLRLREWFYPYSEYHNVPGVRVVVYADHGLLSLNNTREHLETVESSTFPIVNIWYLAEKDRCGWDQMTFEVYVNSSLVANFTRQMYIMPRFDVPYVKLKSTSIELPCFQTYNFSGIIEQFSDVDVSCQPDDIYKLTLQITSPMSSTLQYKRQSLYPRLGQGNSFFIQGTLAQLNNEIGYIEYTIPTTSSFYGDANKDSINMIITDSRGYSSNVTLNVTIIPPPPCSSEHHIDFVNSRWVGKRWVSAGCEYKERFADGAKECFTRFQHILIFADSTTRNIVEYIWLLVYNETLDDRILHHRKTLPRGDGTNTTLNWIMLQSCDPATLIKGMGVTRNMLPLINQTLHGNLLESPTVPDIVVFNSGLWDMKFKGMKWYQEKLPRLMQMVKDVQNEEKTKDHIMRVLWRSTSQGDEEVASDRYVWEKVAKAYNTYADTQVKRFGFEYLDLFPMYVPGHPIDKYGTHPSAMTQHAYLQAMLTMFCDY